VLGPVSLICVGVSAGKASKADRACRMCKDGTAATTIRTAQAQLVFGKEWW
jgi:hypothetical protein